MMRTCRHVDTTKTCNNEIGNDDADDDNDNDNACIHTCI